MEAKLGFGAMRLPQLEDKSIDVEQVGRMVAYAIEHGVTYFDTAWPYHGGMSERVMGQLLSAYPRDAFQLADKFPGHDIADSYDPAGVFAEQLKRCKVEHFDRYMLHNIYERSLSVYEDPQWGILDYFVEQRKQGRIKELGFSTHGRAELIDAYLDRHEGVFDFVQIQLNYLDYTMQQGREKLQIAAKHGLPVIVMEPLRGGKLATLPPEQEAQLAGLRKGESPVAWSFNWLRSQPGVETILSGMSDFSQLEDNIRIFNSTAPLNEAEQEAVLGLAARMTDLVPCTACRYCMPHCPQELDIPTLLSWYNDYRYAPSMTVSMAMEAMPAEKQPSACLGCGACSVMCPQSIDIPAQLTDFAKGLETLPSWDELCKKRAAEQAANKDR